MYNIVGEFSVVGIEFRWAIPNDSKKLEIVIFKGKGPHQITSHNLTAQDKQWLIIISPNDWRINLRKLRERFQLKDDKWIPDEENEISFDPTDFKDRLCISIDLERLFGI